MDKYKNGQCIKHSSAAQTGNIKKSICLFKIHLVPIQPHWQHWKIALEVHVCSISSQFVKLVQNGQKITSVAHMVRVLTIEYCNLFHYSAPITFSFSNSDAKK